MPKKHHRLAGVFALMAGFVCPSLAWASGGGGEQSQTLVAVLTLLTIVAAAFLVTHFLVDWIAKRLGFSTGFQYILLGLVVVLVPGLLAPDLLSMASPAIVLGTGSLGLLAGLNLDFRRPGEIVEGSLTMAFLLALSTFIVVTVIPLILVASRVDAALALQLAPFFFCAGAVACVAEPAPLRSLVEKLGARGTAVVLSHGVATFTRAISVFLFGLIFCFFASQKSAALVAIPALESIVDATTVPLAVFGLHIAVGLVLGLIFRAFLVRDYSDDEILTVVFGLVVFTSGLAYYLDLSPIFVCFVLGTVLANLGGQARQVQRMLESLEQPLYILLFFFAGAGISLALEPSQYLLAVGLGFGYVALRGAGRGLGGLVVGSIFSRTRKYPPLSSVLWAPGGLSAAMLLNFEEVYGASQYAPYCYIALIVGIVLSEYATWRLGTRWFIDATDVALADRNESPSSAGVT